MKRTINFTKFRDEFRVMSRLENFSRDGCRLLYAHLTDFEEETGGEMELDVIALCCEFSEDSPEDIAENYNIDISECDDDEDILNTVLEYLQEQTSVVGVTTNGAIVYELF